jgi:hypothetical protein
MNRNRMASVLRIRQIQERSARGAVATARRRERDAIEAERTTWRLLDERSTLAVRAPGRSAAVALAERMAIASGMLAAATQHTVSERSASEVVAATQHWTVAARRVEGLERLAERTRLVELEVAGRKAANEIDDLVLVRFAEQVAG